MAGQPSRTYKLKICHLRRSARKPMRKNILITSCLHFESNSQNGKITGRRFWEIAAQNSFTYHFHLKTDGVKSTRLFFPLID